MANSLIKNSILHELDLNRYSPDLIRKLMTEEFFECRVPNEGEFFLYRYLKESGVAQCVATGMYNNYFHGELYFSDGSTRRDFVKEGEYIIIPEIKRTQMFLCTKCNSNLPITKIEAKDNNFVCLECFYEDCGSCGRCRNFVHKKYGCEISGNFYCKHCVDEINIRELICHECGEHGDSYSDDFKNFLINGEKVNICYGCREDYLYERCDSCGIYFFDDSSDGEYCDSCHDYYCNNCHSVCPRELFRTNTLIAKIGRTPGEIITSKRLVGIEHEVIDGDYDKRNENRANLVKEIDKTINITRDGSVNKDGIDGLELVYPPRSLDLLEKIVNETCASLKKNHFKVNKTCGLHVHIDAIDFRNNTKKLGNLFRTYYAIEDILFSLNPPSRWNNRYCISIAKNYSFSDFDGNIDISKFHSIWYANKNNIERRISDPNRDYLVSRSGHKYDDTRYTALNLHALNRYGTIEFRHHAGSTNEEKILMWVSVLQAVVDYAVSSRYRKKTVLDLLSMTTGFDKLNKFCEVMKLSNEQKEYLTERVAKFNKDFTKFQTCMKNKSDATHEEIEGKIRAFRRRGNGGGAGVTGTFSGGSGGNGYVISGFGAEYEFTEEVTNNMAEMLYQRNLNGTVSWVRSNVVSNDDDENQPF